MQLSLSLLGDMFWILALSIMAGASRWAWPKIPAGVKVPIQWGRDGAPSMRIGKGLALTGLVILAFVIGAYMKIESLSRVHGFNTLVIVMLVRIASAPLFVIIHLIQVRRALITLAEEDQIKL